MTVLFQSFAAASLLLALALVNCAFLVLAPETSPKFSALLLGAAALTAALAAGAVAVFLQASRNRKEAAYRETCLALGRKPGEPRPPGFAHALEARERELAGAELRTPAEQRRKFTAELLACTALGAAVNLAAFFLLAEGSAEPQGRAHEALGLLPGLLAVSLYGTYKLHLVNRMRELGLIAAILELHRAELGEEETLRRKDLWVIRYLRRSLLHIVYEPPAA